MRSYTGVNYWRTNLQSVNERGHRIPLLEQEGWMRIRKMGGATFESADGVVRLE